MNVTSMSDLPINIKIFPISITVPPPNFEFGFFWFSLAAFYDVFGFFRLRPPGNPDRFNWPTRLFCFCQNHGTTLTVILKFAK